MKRANIALCEMTVSASPTFQWRRMRKSRCGRTVRNGIGFYHVARDVLRLDQAPSAQTTHIDGVFRFKTRDKESACLPRTVIMSAYGNYLDISSSPHAH